MTELELSIYGAIPESDDYIVWTSPHYVASELDRHGISAQIAEVDAAMMAMAARGLLDVRVAGIPLYRRTKA